jgi:hypothetical protein
MSACCFTLTFLYRLVLSCCEAVKWSLESRCKVERVTGICPTESACRRRAADGIVSDDANTCAGVFRANARESRYVDICIGAAAFHQNARGVAFWKVNAGNTGAILDSQLYLNSVLERDRIVAGCAFSWS